MVLILFHIMTFQKNVHLFSLLLLLIFCIIKMTLPEVAGTSIGLYLYVVLSMPTQKTETSENSCYLVNVSS